MNLQILPLPALSLSSCFFGSFKVKPATKKNYRQLQQLVQTCRVIAALKFNFNVIILSNGMEFNGNKNYKEPPDFVGSY